MLGATEKDSDRFWKHTGWRWSGRDGPARFDPVPLPSLRPGPGGRDVALTYFEESTRNTES